MGQGMRSGMVILPLIALTIGLLVFNCRGSDSSPSTPTPRSADATTLQGSWTTTCIADPAKAGYYIQDSRTFDGAAFTTSFETFADDSCTAKVISHAQTGTFEIGDALESDPEIFALDILVDAIFITLHSPSLVQSYNDKQICGGGWTKDEKRQLIRAECDPDGGADAAQDQIFDLFSLSGDTLKFGDKNIGGHNGKSVEARPVALDLSKVFVPE